MCVTQAVYIKIIAAFQKFGERSRFLSVEVFYKSIARSSMIFNDLWVLWINEINKNDENHSHWWMLEGELFWLANGRFPRNLRPLSGEDENQWHWFSAFEEDQRFGSSKTLNQKLSPSKFDVLETIHLRKLINKFYQQTVLINFSSLGFLVSSLRVWAKFSQSIESSKFLVSDLLAAPGS